MNVPTEITRQQVQEALRGLGFTELRGITDVHLSVRKEQITVTYRVRDEDGEVVVINGDCAYQEAVIPVADEPPRAPAPLGSIVVNMQHSSGGSTDEAFAAGRASVLNDLRRRGDI
jgi:hypothetical protein